MTISRITSLVLCLISLVFCIVSCAGVKCHVTAKQIEQPVSFTPCVFNEKGTIVTVKEDNTLKHFKLKKHFLSILYRSINLTKSTWDISEDLKNEISDVDGNAVVNLTVLSRGDWWWYISALVPIIPSSHLVVVEGDIVHIKTGAGRGI